MVEDTGEQYMGSREWLKKFGLPARRLELFDVLAGVAFKHKDGVVDMKYRPETNTQTDAVSWNVFIATDILNSLITAY